MSPAPKPSSTRLLQRLGKGVSAFFTHDVGLKRAADGLHVVLQQQPAKTTPTQTREQETANRTKQELVLMREQLAELLDELPETRDTLRHLVFVEQALVKSGLRALRKLPVKVLERALSQLEGLVTNWSPVGLAALRSKMAVAIIDREHRNVYDEDENHRTAAVMDTMPDSQAPEVRDSSDDDALAAAYAALGDLAPAAVELQGELNSPSARALERDAARPLVRSGTAPGNIQLRELEH